MDSNSENQITAVLEWELERVYKSVQRSLVYLHRRNSVCGSLLDGQEKGRVETGCGWQYRTVPRIRYCSV